MKTSSFKNTAELKYSRKEIFKIFKKQAKQDFPRFNSKEAKGTSTTKNIGYYANRSTKAYIEITDYIEDEIYEVTTTTSKTNITYISRYTLEEIDENTTRLILEESQAGTGTFDTFNHIIQAIFFKGRIKKRFNFMIQALENEIQQMRNNTGSSAKNELINDSREEIATSKEN